MQERVNSILQQNCHLSPKKLLLVGVSGGSDSLCLLDLLIQLGFPLVVAHLNHGLRQESQSDADYVVEVAKAAGLPFIIGKEDVRGFARQFSLSIEEAARNVRYTFLFEQAEQVGAQAVVVAHTADDQVETVLMHFLRGAGLSGLRGMQYLSLPSTWSDQIPLVRPMLGIWREEIQAYLESRGITPLEDQTNLDTSIFRNSLRHELIPYLANYNQEIRRIIWRMAHVLAADHDVIEASLDSAWDECIVEKGDGYVSLRIPVLIRNPDGIQRHLIRKAISCLLPGLRDIDFDTVERTLDFARKPTRSRRSDLAAGIYLLQEDNLLWIATGQASLPTVTWPQVLSNGNCNKEWSLPVPGFIRLADSWRIQAESVADVDAMRQIALNNPEPFQVWIDAASIQLPLRVRNRLPGDRLEPLGMAGKSMKVSDLMINQNIPARLRAHWPLVFSGNKLVWIPGLRLGHSFQISSSTRQAVYLRVYKNQSGLEQSN
jgi:tRNA(Ile)-lysidine synthase